MAQSGSGFVGEIFAKLKARRSLGRHPFRLKIADGKVSQEGMCIFATQFFLQVREFPRAVSALHSRCYDSGERLKLAESLYEEDTGMISGSAPHLELFIRLGLGLRARSRGHGPRQAAGLDRGTNRLV
jgi:pyrroloquinoline quinone (PQQ) biosynthesis protein C